MTMDSDEKFPPKPKIVWRNIILMGLLHTLGLLGFFLSPWARFKTILWNFSLIPVAGLGITAGAHRLWAHRSYKAKLPLRIFLAICNTMALQNSILEWSRDHRGHHKYSETDADPHNAKRGFFFAHIGWLLVRKHPDVIKKGKGLDLSDLHNDPVVMFQDKFYRPMAVFMTIIFPSIVPLLWNEIFVLALFLNLLRMCFFYHATWLVNSAAHMFGHKPYDQTINPSENWMVAIFAMGEGFHNYHHVFPHDYSTSEFGLRLNPTTAFINIMRYFGLAYDCRKVDSKTVLARRKRTGDLKETSD